jgi:catechol 2,3-dioxygenase-like lactoylglutathione lyase family enzyme
MIVSAPAYCKLAREGSARMDLPEGNPAPVYSWLPAKLEVSMQIKFASVMVEEQDKALEFYTGVLGFKKMADIPMGEYRFLTVVSSETPDAPELLLEPMAFPPAKIFQKALFDAGIPATAFTTRDIRAEVAALKSKGVKFRGEPTNAGPIMTVLFEDGCGNLVNLVQPL